MYELEEEIIHFVFIAFEGMKRKKENVALAFHSIMVGNMLKNLGCDEKTICIGFLHDIIEDTSYTYNDLVLKFGVEIANGVLQLTEDRTIFNYLDRKKAFIKQLELVDDNILLIEVADKLQNLLSDYEQYKIKGKQFLITETNSFDELRWFYLELKKIFNYRIKNNKLLDRYNQITFEYFEA